VQTRLITLIIFNDITSIMRTYGMILCSVLLMVMVFFPGCTTQDTGYPDATAAQQGVNGTSLVTPPAPPFENLHLPLAPPTPQVVYVPVTVPVPAQTPGTEPVPVPTSVETVCTGGEHPAADLRIAGNVYGHASVTEAGIDEIRFTLGLDPCSPPLDLTKVQIVFSTPGTFPVTLAHGTRTSTGFFTAKTGTTRVTSLNPGDQAEITFFIAPVPANTMMTFEVKPSGGAALLFTTTAPARISATNILS
jgi:archaellin